VGKSSLIMRFLKGSFSEQYNVTVGVEYASKIVSIDEKTFVRLQIWDTVYFFAFRQVSNFSKQLCVHSIKALRLYFYYTQSIAIIPLNSSVLG
jgi:GTPase SAR1 family protein